MKNIRIGIVSEGVTDFEVLRVFLNKICQNVKQKFLVEFVSLAPYEDNTGVRKEGWTAVKSWCDIHDPSKRVESFFSKPLFENLDSYSLDLIVFHLDSDILEFILNDNMPEGLDDPRVREVETRRILSNWVWQNNEPNHQYLLAPAVECIEAWIVAALTDHKNVYGDKGVMEKFVDLLYKKVRQKQKGPPSAQGFRKKPAQYHMLAKEASDNLGVISKKCGCFSKVSDDFENALTRM